MPNRQFETEFLNIATFLYDLANENPRPLQPTKEILLRTHINRSYYYIYHTTRRGTLNQILQDSKDKNELLKNLEYMGLKEKDIEEIFRQHRLLRQFYKELNRLGLESAGDIADTLEIYNIYRVLADYHIDTPTPKYRKSGRTIRIDFTAQTLTAGTWKLLSPEYIEKKTMNLLSKITSIFNNIRNSGYSYDTALILARLKREQQKNK